MTKETAMKTTAAIIGVIVLLIAGWTQREYIGSELGLTPFGSDAAIEIDTSRIVTRRVWAGPGVDLTGSASPDGAFLSFVDWTTGDLAIRDLAIGESRHLTDKGSWSESEQLALYSVVSRDGQHVAYTWLNEDLGLEIRVIPIEGVEEQVVVKASHEWLQPYDWSPDSRHLLIRVVDTTGVNRLGLVPVGGGAFRSLATLRDGRSPLRATFSPDGRFVVFDDHADGDPPQLDVYVVPVEGGRRRALVEHPANDLVFGWSPDGSSILFASNRTGTLAAWLIPTKDGRTAGNPVLVKSDLWRANGMGFARDGAFFYGIEVGSGDVYVAGVDVASGRVLTPPTAASQRFLGSNSTPEWSPDGQYLAYVSRQGPGPMGTGSVIVIRSLATGDERTINPDMSTYQRLRWSPDGRFLLTAGTDRRSNSGIFVIDVLTGVTRRIAERPPGGALMSPDWLRDGTAIVYVERLWPPESRDRIVSLEVESGRAAELGRWNMEEYWVWQVATSPAGDQIAFSRTDAKAVTPVIYVMPATGGPEREVARLPAKQYVPWDLNWTPDGSHLIYVTRTPANPGRPRQVWAVAAAGGEPHPVGIEDTRLGQLRIHPDGRRIAYRAGEEQQEVWVMEDFLPEPTDREQRRTEATVDLSNTEARDD
jgi:Tol biopolymer transport system component